MWLMLNDAFLSIVKKDCPPDHLLVRARRPGDIEKVFGRRVKVTRQMDADYLYRGIVAREDVEEAMDREVGRIDYDNFKNSVEDRELHDAYLKVWTAMSEVQNPRPYSEPYRAPTQTSRQRDEFVAARDNRAATHKKKGDKRFRARFNNEGVHK